MITLMVKIPKSEQIAKTAFTTTTRYWTENQLKLVSEIRLGRMSSIYEARISGTEQWVSFYKKDNPKIKLQILAKGQNARV